MKTPQPQRPATAPRILPSVGPKRNTKKIENSEERRLLLQVIAEAKAFRRPDMRKRRDGEK
jgi:hypothetical protein